MPGIKYFNLLHLDILEEIKFINILLYIEIFIPFLQNLDLV